MTAEEAAGMTVVAVGDMVETVIGVSKAKLFVLEIGLTLKSLIIYCEITNYIFFKY
jgi:hypothetical protein